MSKTSWGLDKKAYTFPKMHIIMIVNPLASAAEIEKFTKEYPRPPGSPAYPIWRTPDMEDGKCAIRCAIEDDISNEFSGLYED